MATEETPVAPKEPLWLAIDVVTKKPLEVIVSDTENAAYKVHALLVSGSMQELLEDLQGIFGKGDDGWLKFRYAPQPNTLEELKQKTTDISHIFFKGAVAKTFW